MKVWIVLALEILAIILVGRSLARIHGQLLHARSERLRSRKDLLGLQALIARRYLSEAALHALIVTSACIVLVLLSVFVAEILGRSSSDVWAAKRWLVAVRSLTSYAGTFLGTCSLILGIIALWIVTQRAAKQMGADLAESVRSNGEGIASAEVAAVREEILRQGKDPQEAFSGDIWGDVWADRQVLATREALDAAWERFLNSLPASVDRSRIVRPWDASTASSLEGWIAIMPNRTAQTEDALKAVGETYGAYLAALSEAYVRIANDPDRIPGEEGAAVGALLKEGLHANLRKGNRLAYWVGLALLVPAWMGVLGDPALRSKSLSATDLALTRMNGASAQSQPESSGSNDASSTVAVLTPRDHTTIRRVAQLIEERTFGGFDPFTAPPKGGGGGDTPPRQARRSPPGDSAWIEYQVRSGTARETILHEAADSVNTQGQRRRYEYATITEPAPYDPRWLDGPDGDVSGGSRPNPPTSPSPVKPGPGGMDIPPSGSQAARQAGASADAKRAEAFLRIYEEVQGTDGPASRFGRTVAVAIGEEFARSPRDLEAFHAHWDPIVAPDSQNPIRRRTIKRILVEVLFDHAGEHIFGTSGGLGKVASELIGGTVADYQDQRDVSRIRAAIAKDAVVRQLRSGASPEQTLSAVESALANTGDIYARSVRRLYEHIDLSHVRDSAPAYGLEASADVLRQKPPTVARIEDEGVDYAEARKVLDEDVKARLDRYSERTGKQPTPAIRALVGEDSAQVLATYDSYFPSQLGVDEATEHGKFKQQYFPDALLASAREEGNSVRPSGPPDNDAPPFGGASGGGNDGRGSRRVNLSNGTSPGGQARFFRSRSFAGLRGFTRIGGVLLGRPPKANGDYTDLMWRRTADNKIVLRLTDAAGTVSESAPYRPELVLLALRYAADGRQTTVTMVRAAPMRSLKVLLHPSLLDTGDGLRLVELDTLTDKYASPILFNEAGRVRGEVSRALMDQQAVYEVMWAMSAKENSLLFEEPDDWTWMAKNRDCQEEFESGLISERYRTALRELCDPTLSPYAAHPEITHPKLMEQIRELAKTGSFDSNGIERAVSNARVTKDDAQPLQWLPWSGVRELPYNTSPRELLMQRADDVSDLPMEFMWQVAFDTKDDTRSVEAWESAKLKAILSQWVAKSATDNAEDKEVLLTAREFTYLQRLFRCGFQGHLGASFPVERLVDLHRAVLDREPAREWTPRWTKSVAEERLYARLQLDKEELARRERLFKALGLEQIMARTQQSRAEFDRALETALRNFESRRRRNSNSGTSRSFRTRTGRGPTRRR